LRPRSVDVQSFRGPTSLGGLERSLSLPVRAGPDELGAPLEQWALATAAHDAFEERKHMARASLAPDRYLGGRPQHVSKALSFESGPFES
jgi:hypothetical protein